MIYIIFFISITIHEIGHILMSKALKVKIGKPRYNFIGYSSKINNGNKLSKLLVYLSGPVSNFIFAIIFYFAKMEFKIKVQFFYTNIFLGIANLLPVLPLDGGNIVELMLEKKFKFDKSMKIALCVSKIVLILITLICCFTILIIKNIWIFVSLIYLWIIYINEDEKFDLYMKIKIRAKKCLQ